MGTNPRSMGIKRHFMGMNWRSMGINRRFMGMEWRVGSRRNRSKPP
jgi:hypothetical protein